MGLLRWLGIEKYLKKMKAYVDAQDENTINSFTENVFSQAIGSIYEQVTGLADVVDKVAIKYVISPAVMEWQEDMASTPTYYYGDGAYEIIYHAKKIGNSRILINTLIIGGHRVVNTYPVPTDGGMLGVIELDNGMQLIATSSSMEDVWLEEYSPA